MAVLLTFQNIAAHPRWPVGAEKLEEGGKNEVEAREQLKLPPQHSSDLFYIRFVNFTNLIALLRPAQRVKQFLKSLVSRSYCGHWRLFHILITPKYRAIPAFASLSTYFNMRHGALFYAVAVFITACLACGPAAASRHITITEQRRQLLQSCNSCPPNASQTCSALSPNDISSIRGDLISKCGSSEWNAQTCCALRSNNKWDTYAACACSDVIPGLSAFIDASRIMSTCGCGTTSASATASGRSSSSSSGGSSMGAPIDQIMSAISFVGGGGSSSRSSASVSSSSGSQSANANSASGGGNNNRGNNNNGK